MKRKYILPIFLCLALAAGILGVYFWEQAPERPEEAPATEASRPVLRDVETILIMGLDKYQAPMDEMGYLNDQQSDFLMLVILDPEKASCELLHLNRDTMTKIQRLGVGGGAAGSFTGQLALAHTYGSGGSDSCINAVKAVSNLLGGVPVDHYITMTMETVGILNDLAGGVTVKLMDDFTHLDPDFQKGSTVTLHGEQALSYVRSRGGLEDSSNLHRMERQRQYLEALMLQLQACVKADPNFMTGALKQVYAYLNSDYSLQQLSDLGTALEHCSIAPIETIDGEAVKGETYMEFYPDEEALRAVVQKLFYE